MKEIDDRAAQDCGEHNGRSGSEVELTQHIKDISFIASRYLLFRKVSTG